MCKDAKAQRIEDLISAEVQAQTHAYGVGEVQHKNSTLNGLLVLIPGRLSMLPMSKKRISSLHSRPEQAFRFITSKLHHRYFPFADDFGPVNLGVVFRFNTSLAKSRAKHDRMLIYCVETTDKAIANASFLLASYMVLKCGLEPRQVADLFSTSSIQLRPFRDATSLPQDFNIYLFDCLNTLVRSSRLSWLDIDNFDVDRYLRLEDPSFGDIHQVCPKFIAFKGPLSAESNYRLPDEIAFPPEHYVCIFRELGVSCVVRLNEADTYDCNVFKRAGLRHHDLFFDDCTLPPDHIVQSFLEICSGEEGIVAVHCRAGLGRTGTLIALWMMREKGFGANEAIAWLRIVRPGSVLGPQQHYLRDSELQDRFSRGMLGRPANFASLAEEESLAAYATISEKSCRLAAQVTSSMCSRAAAVAAGACRARRVTPNPKELGSAGTSALSDAGGLSLPATAGGPSPCLCPPLAYVGPSNGSTGTFTPPLDVSRAPISIPPLRRSTAAPVKRSSWEARTAPPAGGSEARTSLQPINSEQVKPRRFSSAARLRPITVQDGDAISVASSTGPGQTKDSTTTSAAENRTCQKMGTDSKSQLSRRSSVLPTC